jgi:C1A family cysteine protease
MTTNVYGRLPHTPDPRDYLARAPKAYTGAYVDLSGGFPDPCYDQGQLGSCVSQAVAAAMDFDRRKQGLTPLSPPSRLFIYFVGRDEAGYPLDQDTGLQVRDGFKAVNTCGAPPESEWPYADDPITFTKKPSKVAYTDGVLDEAVVYGAVTSIDDMIASGYPVAIGFDVYDSFEDTSSTGVAATGVMPVPDVTVEKIVGGHCVLACSTVIDGKDIPGGLPGRWYRLCRNSWGHDGTWGLPTNPGHFYMPVDVMGGPMTSEAWQVTTVSSPDAPTPPPAPDPGAAPFPGALASVADHMVKAADRAGLSLTDYQNARWKHYFNL